MLHCYSTHKFKQGLILLAFFSFSQVVLGQTDLKIGSNSGVKNNSAVLELESTTKGLLLPRMTTIQMNTIGTPANGLTIYNTTDSCVWVYRNSLWMSTCSPSYSLAWGLSGNSGTTIATNFIGTTDAQSVAFRTSNTERMRILSTGNIGIGTTAPAYKLDIESRTGSTGNPLRLLGLNAGVTADSLLSSSSGIIRRMSFNDYLSAANGVTGTGVATRVAFWNSANSLSSNANLYWDNVNGRLSVGTAVPLNKLDVEGAAVIGAAYSGTSTAPANGLLVQGSMGLGTAAPAYKLDIESRTGSIGNPLRLLGLNAGVTADSLVTSSSGIIRRMSFNDYLSASNGITGTGVATRVAFWNSANSLSSNANLYWDNVNGRLSVGTAVPLNKLDVEGATVVGAAYSGTSTAPANGLLVQGSMGLGTAAPAYKLDIESRTGSTGNPLRLLGLNAGVTADSLVTSSNGVIRRMGFNEYLSASNGVTGTGVATRVAFWNSANSLSSNANLYWDNVNGRLSVGTAVPLNKLDVEGAAVIGASYSGTSTAPTNGLLVQGSLGLGTATPAYKLDIDANTGGTGNPLRLQGLQAGAGTDSVMTSLNGLLRRVDAATLISSANNSWLLGGNTLLATASLGTNSNHNLDIETNGTTRLTITNAGAITQSGTGQVIFTGNVNATNGLDVTTGVLTANAGSTLTGVTNINTTGVTATNIGNAGSTTTVLGSININSTGTATTAIGNATSIVNIAGNNLNVTNLATGVTTDELVSVNATGDVRKMSISTVIGAGLTADNGLTKNTGTNVRLGGTLVQNTAIAQAGFDLNFSGGDVAIGTTSAPTSTLQLAGSMGISQRQVIASTTLAATDFVVFANATAGGFTLTLPTASTCTGRTYYLNKIDESSNTVTFSPALRLTVSSSISAINYPKKFRVVSDGTDWWIYSE